MLDSLALLICAGTFIPFVLLLPPAVREEYCPCCCCLPSLHLVQEDEDEDAYRAHRDRSCSRRGSGGGGGRKATKYADSRTESSTDSKSDSEDELTRRTDELRRSRSRAEKNKKLKHSGKEPRKPKNDRKNSIHSSSYSSEDEESGSNRKNKEGVNKSPRHGRKNHRDELPRRTDDVRRSRSRVDKGKALKHSEEEQRNRKKGSPSYVRKTYSKNSRWNSDGHLVGEGDLIHTNEEIGIIRWKNKRCNKSSRNSGGEVPRRTDELRRSRSRLEKGKSLKHSGEEQRNINKDSAIYLRKNSLLSSSSNGGESINTYAETGSSHWKNGNTSGFPRHAEEGQRRIKEQTASHILRKSLVSSSWSSNGGDSINTYEETGSARWRKEYISKTSRQSGEDPRKTKKGTASYIKKTSSKNPEVPEGEDSIYQRKTTEENRGRRIEGGDTQRSQEGDSRRMKEEPRPTKDESPRETEDPTLHSFETVTREGEYSLEAVTLPNTEGLGGDRRPNEDTNNICRQGPGEGPRRCNPDCLGLRSSTATGLRIPGEDNQRSKFDDKFSLRSHVSQLRESRQDPPGSCKFCQRKRSILLCGCSNSVFRCR